MRDHAGAGAARSDAKPSEAEAEDEYLERGEADCILNVQGREEDRRDDNADSRQQRPTKEGFLDHAGQYAEKDDRGRVIEVAEEDGRDIGDLLLLAGGDDVGERFDAKGDGHEDADANDRHQPPPLLAGWHEGKP